MSATFEYNEDNGAAVGSPAKGTTRSTAVVQNNWKNVDDVASVYSAYPITAGNNSFSKYQFGKFTGAFNRIITGKWSAHTAGALGTGLTLKGTVSSTYATPATGVNAALTTDFTAIVAVAAGLDVLFSTVGPEGASPTAELNEAGFTQYLITQLQVSVAAAAGDTAVVTSTLSYYEN